jgi:hypothetical protein
VQRRRPTAEAVSTQDQNAHTYPSAPVVKKMAR